MKEQQLHCEPVKCNLIGVDGNAYSLMGHWQRCARKEGRTREEIEAVIKDAMSGDYHNLIYVLDMHCK